MTGWDTWQSTFAGASGPLPDVHARTAREAHRHRRTNVSVALLLGAASLAAIPAFAAPEEPVHVIGWGILGFCAAMGIGAVWLHRQVGARDVGGPREALGFLERRLRSERRAAHLARWVYLPVSVLGAVATQVLYVQHGSPMLVRVLTLACFLFGAAFSASAPWWFERTARRRATELDGWRRWIESQGL